MQQDVFNHSYHIPHESAYAICSTPLITHTTHLKDTIKPTVSSVKKVFQACDGAFKYRLVSIPSRAYLRVRHCFGVLVYEEVKESSWSLHIGHEVILGIFNCGNAIL
jgi:hypothetical protein